MMAPSAIVEVFLQPGETYFGERETRIRTLLGSCVSVTLWHPRHCIGGMCHFMLPWRARRKRGALDGRYGNEAMEILLQDIRNCGTQPAEYEAKIFGGGGMFSGKSVLPCREFEVGERNVLCALALVEIHGFFVKSKHLGGMGHRNIIFDLWSGDVWMKHVTEMVKDLQDPTVST